MKKIFLSLGFILFTSVCLNAQTIQSVFKTIPDDILLGLEAEEKSALLSDSKDSVIVSTENEIYPNIRRIGFSSDFISLQTSDSAFLQIKLLPLVNDSKIICVVNTVCGRICDSQIRFYTPDWKPIPTADLFPQMDINSFLKSDVNTNDEDFVNAISPLDITFIKLSLSADNNDITADLDAKNYLIENDYKKLELYLTTGGKTLIWDKSRYK